mmetsp:Transcript_102216/g.218845  ORF Transcript_102216/g.218845 Transcript_102216/m.218845 type:complete len:318 (-) Transcript_102216:72-1025(-)
MAPSGGCCCFAMLLPSWDARSFKKQETSSSSVGAAQIESCVANREVDRPAEDSHAAPFFREEKKELEFAAGGEARHPPGGAALGWQTANDISDSLCEVAPLDQADDDVMMLPARLAMSGLSGSTSSAAFAGESSERIGGLALADLLSVAETKPTPLRVPGSAALQPLFGTVSKGAAVATSSGGGEGARRRPGNLDGAEETSSTCTGSGSGCRSSAGDSEGDHLLVMPSLATRLACRQDPVLPTLTARHHSGDEGAEETPVMETTAPFSEVNEAGSPAFALEKGAVTQWAALVPIAALQDSQVKPGGSMFCAPCRPAG